MIRILLVDDQSLVCHGLKAMLAQEADLQVVGTANNGEIAIEQVTALEPNLVLMDMHMPVMNGRDAIRLICQKFPDVKVLALSTSEQTQDIVEAIRAGAKGYLFKNMLSDELIQSIRMVHRGYSQLAPGVLEKLMMHVTTVDVVESNSVNQPWSQLTPRETEVLSFNCPWPYEP